MKGQSSSCFRACGCKISPNLNNMLKVSFFLSLLNDMRLNKRNYFHVCESFSCFEKKMQSGMKPNHIFINGARWVFSYFAILKMKLFSEHLTASIHLLVDF